MYTRYDATFRHDRGRKTRSIYLPFRLIQSRNIRRGLKSPSLIDAYAYEIYPFDYDAVLPTCSTVFAAELG